MSPWSAVRVDQGWGCSSAQVLRFSSQVCIPYIDPETFTWLALWMWSHNGDLSDLNSLKS